MSDPFIGKQLGDYTIQSLLGRGGMARVYKGYDDRLQRYAAVKVINNDPTTANIAEYTERFRREARSIARLHHPNIVGVYQFGEFQSNYYMAMVFVEGEDLRQILKEYADKNERMPLSEVLHIIQGIASALDYAHSRGVIHRDIKPSNIMIDSEERPVLTDFGLALNLAEGTLGDTFGSAHYIAPEQAVSSAKAVPQSDLYSLGVCLYEMLTGKVPFDDPSAMSVALKHLNDPPPSPRTFNPEISQAIEKVVLRVLDKDPMRRYPSGAVLAQALEIAITTDADDQTAEIAIPPSPVVVKPPVPTIPFHARAPETDEILRIIEADTAPGETPGGKQRRTERKSNEDNVVTARADVREIRKGAQAPALLNLETPMGGPPPGLKVGSPPGGKAGAASRRRIPLLVFLVLLLIAAAAILYASGAFASLLGGTTAAPTEAVSLDSTRTLLGTEQAANSTGTAIAASLNMTKPATVPATGSGTTAATRSVSGTASKTATNTATPTRTATTTHTPTSTRTAVATSMSSAAVTTLPATAAATTQSVGTADGSQDVLLVYDDSQLVLINVSGHTLNISNLVFVQRGKTELKFDTSMWRQYNVSITPDAVPPQFCFQVFRNDRPQPDMLRPCRRVTWARVADPRWFWFTQDAAVTSFDVLSGDRVIATCTLNTGQCEFVIP